MENIVTRLMCLFVMRFALGNEKCLGVFRAADFVDKSIRVVNPSAPVTVPIFQWFCTWSSPRSSERMDSASARWLASDQNGSGLSDITSNGRRRRITDWRRNRRMALDISSPAFVNKRSASLRRPLSIRICSVDVAILYSFVFQTDEIISKFCFKNNIMQNFVFRQDLQDSHDLSVEENPVNPVKPVKKCKRR